MAWLIISKQFLEQKPHRKKQLLLWSYPLVWLVEWGKQILRPPLYKNGIHAVIGDTGSGKTLIIHILTQRFIKQGYTVVSNSKFNDDVKVIDIKEYFKDGKQVKPLTNCIVILDEVMKEFNRRDNKKKEYNDSFIPFISWLATHRHDRVPKIYLLSQSYNMFDIQITNLIQRVNFVTSKVSPDPAIWIRQKKYFSNALRPKKIFYYSKRKKDIDQNDLQKYIQVSETKVYNKSVRRGKQIYRKTPRYFEKVTLSDLVTYNTYAFENKYKAYLDPKKATE